MSVINNNILFDRDHDVIMRTLPPLPQTNLTDFEGDIIMQAAVTSLPPAPPIAPSSFAPTFREETPNIPLANRTQQAALDSLGAIFILSLFQQAYNRPVPAPSAPPSEQAIPNRGSSQNPFPFVETSLLPSSFHLTQEENPGIPPRPSSSVPFARPENPSGRQRDERDLFDHGERPLAASALSVEENERRIESQNVLRLAFNRPSAVASSALRSKTRTLPSSTTQMPDLRSQTHKKTNPKPTGPAVFTNSLSLAPSNALSRPNAVRPTLNGNANLHTAPSVRAARQAKFPGIVRLPFSSQEPLLSTRDDEIADTNQAPLKKSKK